MNAIKTVSWTLSIAAIAIFFAGCSQSPSVDDGEKIFRLHFDFQEQKGAIKFVGFKKNDGQKGEIKNQEGMTVESYSMRYSAEVEAIQSCVLSLKFGLIYVWGKTNDADAFNLYSDLHPGQIGNGPDDDVAMKMNPGQRCIIEGKIIFEKTEKGWSYHESKADSLQPEALQ